MCAAQDFSEKPKGDALEVMKVDTTLLGGRLPLGAQCAQSSRPGFYQACASNGCWKPSVVCMPCVRSAHSAMEQLSQEPAWHLPPLLTAGSPANRSTMTGATPRTSSEGVRVVALQGLGHAEAASCHSVQLGISAQSMCLLSVTLGAPVAWLSGLSAAEAAERLVSALMPFHLKP